jgi:hypothetical protein
VSGWFGDHNPDYLRGFRYDHWHEDDPDEDDEDRDYLSEYREQREWRRSMGGWFGPDSAPAGSSMVGAHRAKRKRVTRRKTKIAAKKQQRQKRDKRRKHQPRKRWWQR